MAQDPFQNYIDTTLNPIMEELISEALTHQPKDILSFSIDWMRGKIGEDLSVSEKDELKHLRTEVARLQAAKSTESGSDQSYVSDEDDYVDELPLPVSNKDPPKRASVSEEAYGLYNKAEDFNPRVIEKTPEQVEQITERLSHSFMFSSLGDKERRIVINAFEERKAPTGDTVITQGEDGDELFLVDSGELACYKKFSGQEEEKYLKDYIPGDAFGELALLYNAPRAATIRAKTDASLWVLDRGTFKHIVKDAARNKREQYEDFLSKVELLENMDAYERSQVADAFNLVQFNDGDYVLREGEHGDIFYFITEGEAVATKTLSEGSEPEQVKEYNVGDYFGELALLKNEPRAANIIAKGSLSCVTLDRYSFKRMLGPLDSILQRNAAKYEEILKNK